MYYNLYYKTIQFNQCDTRIADKPNIVSFLSLNNKLLHYIKVCGTE